MNLSSLLADEFRLTEYQKKALKKLKIETVKDLLWHFPSRYEEPGTLKTISDAAEGDNATFRGKVAKINFEKTWRKKMNIARATLNDGTGTVNLVWFHQPFVASILKEGEYISASGKIQKNSKGIYIANPVYDKIIKSDFGKIETESQKTLLAIYPETRGLSSRWFRFRIGKILKSLEDPEDIVPDDILNKYHLPSLKNALLYIHIPKNRKNAEAARKRFAFEEIFLIQLSRVKKRIEQRKEKSFIINNDKDALNNFVKKFGFELTKSQKNAVNHIIEDFGRGFPMARFLEGDVGSGKTAVAAAVSFLVVKNRHQVAYMAPTEVLARQLFNSFMKYFGGTNVKIGFITSSGSEKFPSKSDSKKPTKISKARLLKWLREGEIDIIIGTHSLIQDAVKFSAKEKNIYKEKKLALVIIDEQHRFGTNQRAALAGKKNESDEALVPHFLSMSATPIPRTLALTIYGDLDLAILDEMPPGRKKIITEIVPQSGRNSAYEKIRGEIKRGRQAYVVCPRIETPDKTKENLLTINMRAVKEEYEKLSKKIFPEFKIDMLHGKMKSKEKEETMKNFEKGDTDILVATSVIEVGVNVPNATIIIIEGADRFGLAQLHQLRGRVLRSTHQPYCFVFSESRSQKTPTRLKALLKARNGFELAEYDLKFRGPGELSGKKQWGITDVGMEALKNLKMVEAARLEAQNILKKDPGVKKYPLLKKKLIEEGLEIHFE